MALGLIWIAAIRLAGLNAYFRIEADEGGWPLAVRQWLEEGTRTFDFYMAPGYHWLLGSSFWIFGADHTVARLTAAVWGLAGLWLFHRLTTRLAGPQVAWWSLLLLGTSYAALMVDRRAFIEPFQITLMLALCLTVVEARHWLAAFLTALLLLTKASAIFLLPVLVLARLWPGPWRENWRGALHLGLALAAGAAVAAAVFGWFYLSDPSTFLYGWSKDMRAVNLRQAGESSGRFAFNLVSTARTLRFLAIVDPPLVALAALGAGRALVERRHPLMLLWLLAGGAFLGMQLYVAPQHRAVLFAPLCFLAGWLLSDWDRGAALHRLRLFGGHLAVNWPRACLAGIMLFSAGRLLLFDGRHAARDTGGARWLAGQAAPGETVVAAPYVVMQLRQIRPVSFFTLPEPFLPTPAALRQSKAAWVVVDEREWQMHMLDSGATAQQIDAALADCCDLAHQAAGSRVYRVRPAAR